MNGADDPTGSIVSQATRGYTGHEMLADIALVHMNGRVYDPSIARVASADIFVVDPADSQSWNRYSYVANRPLNHTDPSGWSSESINLDGITLAHPTWFGGLSLFRGPGWGQLFGGSGIGGLFGGTGFGFGVRWKYGPEIWA